jgi:dCTP deaminase
MAVVPLVVGQSVVTSDDHFERRMGRRGSSLLIRNFDVRQLQPGRPNLSYDLRVGSVYKDHADGVRRELPERRDGHDAIALEDEDDEVTKADHAIKLFPGGAVIIETEESLHMPAGLFGYIVPRVRWLQRGVSNTLSKVDSGYNGKLLVTVFNLGQKTILMPHKARFCSLVAHDVGQGVCPYDGPAKTIGDERPEPLRIRIRNGLKVGWQNFRGLLNANRAVLDLALIVVTGLLVLAKVLELFDVHLHAGKLLRYLR